jgi:ABC-type Fe3+-siderophore transport system permease subunit
MKRIGIEVSVVAAGLISFLVAAASLFCGIPAMLWLMDTLHGNGIARQWMVVAPTGMLIGIFAIFCWMSVKDKGRVSAPEVHPPLTA